MLTRLDGIIAAVNELVDETDGNAGEASVEPTNDATRATDALEAAPSATGNRSADSTVAAGADPQMLSVFISEAAEHLDAAQHLLLGMESAGSVNGESLDAVFRECHSVKGNAGFPGLSETNTLAHEAETPLDMVQAGEATLDETVSDPSLRAIDAIRAIVVTLDDGAEGERTRRQRCGQ
ncbi:MAG: Hpt domain-containing protein [Planctomycetota bacterium]